MVRNRPVVTASGIPSGTLLSVPELMLDLSRTYMPEAEQKRVRFLLEADVSVPRLLEGDGQGVRRMIGILIDEAFAAEHRKLITVKLSHDGGMLILQVSDHGTDAGTENRAGRESTEARCRTLAEAMGGRLDMESLPDSGAECTVWLPLTHSDASMGLGPGEEMVLRWLTADLEVSDLAEGVLRSVPDRMVRIRNQIQGGDVAGLKDAVHAFKGLAGNFHMDELYQCLLVIDEHLKDHTFSEEPFSECMEALETLVRSIPSKYLKKTGE